MSENTLPDETSVHAHVGMICFKTGPPHLVGIELEWLLSSTSHPDQHLVPTTLDGVIRDLTPMPGSRTPAAPNAADPRYDAMQDYFDRRGEAGLTMMTGTAAVQVNLDAGADTVDVARRWSLLHAVGPALVAAFANSPPHLGRVTGWKSTRQRVMATMDPTRRSAPRGPDPVTTRVSSCTGWSPTSGRTWTGCPRPTVG